MKPNDIRENCLIVAQITGSGNRRGPVFVLTFLSLTVQSQRRVYGAYLFASTARLDVLKIRMSEEIF